jgi:hypothetical protein
VGRLQGQSPAGSTLPIGAADRVGQEGTDLLPHSRLGKEAPDPSLLRRWGNQSRIPELLDTRLPEIEILPVLLRQHLADGVDHAVLVLLFAGSMFRQLLSNGPLPFPGEDRFEVVRKDEMQQGVALDRCKLDRLAVEEVLELPGILQELSLPVRRLPTEPLSEVQDLDDLPVASRVKG